MPPQPNPFFSTVLNPPNPDPNSPTTPSHPSSSFARPQPPSDTFTSNQRSLQARNQPFHTSPSASESFDVRERREEAAKILESVELLLWYSTARNESIAQTRFYYENVLRGIPMLESEVLWKEEWEVPVEQRVNRDDGGGVGSPRSAKGKEKVRKRG